MLKVVGRPIEMEMPVMQVVQVGEVVRDREEAMGVEGHLLPGEVMLPLQRVGDRPTVTTQVCGHPFYEGHLMIPF